MPARASRGEIWLVDLGLAQKLRPALIPSVDFLDNERAVVAYVPRTTSQRGTRFEVPHLARGFDTGAFDAQGLDYRLWIKFGSALRSLRYLLFKFPLFHSSPPCSFALAAA